MMRPLNPDANAILARLKQERINALYHFTSVENLLNICEMQALWSKKMLEDEGRWPPPIPGGNTLSHSLDRYNGNWNKVPLNLTPHTPMVYGKKRKEHLCFFIINYEVATWSGVVFTDSNAAGTTDQRRDEGLAGLNYIDFEAIRSVPRPWDRDGWFRPVQAEVLVPNRIPLAHVSEVAFVSRASMIHAERLCGTLPHPPFIVKNQLFSDSPRAPQGVLGFPYVMELILTNTKIDKNMVYLSRIHENKYSKKANDYIIVVALVKAMAGTQAKIILRQVDVLNSVERIVGTKEFAISNQDSSQHKIFLNQLPVGIYSVEYYLNNLCWASTTFEVVQ